MAQPQSVNFAHNFGGRASATEFSSIVISQSNGTVLHTIVDPSEFRIRENGTITIYSRRHRSTSVYGVDPKRRIFTGIKRDRGILVPLDL